MIALLMTGYAIGLPIGQSRGFSAGSEWAFVQADILAREAGLVMPVTFQGGQFRVTLKQPKHLYRSAWLLADRHEDEMAYLSRGDGALNESVQLRLPGQFISQTGTQPADWNSRDIQKYMGQVKAQVTEATLPKRYDN
jgi:hypothetical protein